MKARKRQTAAQFAREYNRINADLVRNKTERAAEDAAAAALRAVFIEPSKHERLAASHRQFHQQGDTQ